MSSEHQDPLARLFDETATTTRDAAFAARVERALATRRLYSGTLLLATLKPLGVAAAVGGAAVIVSALLQGTPYGGIVIAGAALAVLGWGRRRAA